MVGVSPLPGEVQAAMRAARMRYATAMSVGYVVAGTIATVFVAWRMDPSLRDLAFLMGAILVLAVLANVVRPFWIHRPVMRLVPLPAADAAQALAGGLRGRGRPQALAGGILVGGPALLMPAWFVDTPEGTWVATTSGTAGHLDRSLAKLGRARPV